MAFHFHKDSAGPFFLFIDTAGETLFTANILMKAVNSHRNWVGTDHCG